MEPQDDAPLTMASDVNAIVPGYELRPLDTEALLKGRMPDGLADLLTTTRDLFPETFAATLEPGESVSEEKRASLSGAPPIGDVLFSFDLTGSMSGELNNARDNAADIMAAVRGVIPGAEFGVISYKDYPGEYTNTDGCYLRYVGAPPTYTTAYGDPDAFPYDMNQGITADANLIIDALAPLEAADTGDGPESYARALYETYSDPDIAWRPGAKRIVVNFADNIPHDCDLKTGWDPGRNGVIENGAGDDLDWDVVIPEMAASNVTLINLFSERNEFYSGIWEAAAAATGGVNFQINPDGSFPGDVDPAAAIADLIATEVQTIDDFTIGVCSGFEAYEGWLTSVSPAGYGPIDLSGPNELDFTLTFTAPIDAPSGLHSFQVCGIGDGAEYGRQTVDLTVLGDVPPPLVVPMVNGTMGNNGWFTSDVDIAWDIQLFGGTIQNQSGCDATLVDQDTGELNLPCSVTTEGGTASASVSIKRDATPPEVTYGNNAGSYAPTDEVAITCTASDNLSGVASTDCADIVGLAETFGLGSHTFSATAVDNAGNQGSGTTTFVVAEAETDLCALVQQSVDHKGVANSLCAKVRAAEKSEARGNLKARNGSLSAFINEVKAQTGKKVPADKAPALIAAAEAWMAS